MEDNIEKITIKDVSVKWGLIAGVIGIVFSLILVLGDLMFVTGISFIGWLPFGIVLFMAYKEFKEQGDTYMSFGEALKIGLMVSLIGGIILSVFMFVYSQFIDPGLMDRIKDYSIEKMQEQGNSDEQIDQAMKFMSYMFNPYLGLIIGLLKTVLVGFILSLIIGAFTKNSNPELEV